jgi:hypothetical protein
MLQEPTLKNNIKNELMPTMGQVLANRVIGNFTFLEKQNPQNLP